jgi:hypothetical protein
LGRGDKSWWCKSIKLLANIREYDENLYTGYMRELRDFSQKWTLYIRHCFFIYSSRNICFCNINKNIIPIEDYGNIVAPIIDQLVSNSELAQFTQGWYQRNNFKVNDIIPIFPNVNFG